MRSNRGEAFAVVHPHCPGITPEEIELGLVRAETNGGMDSPDYRFRASAHLKRDFYTASFEATIAESPDPVGFVFESVGKEDASIDALLADARLAQHVEHLQSIDPHRREWVVIPTRENGPDPILFPTKFPFDPAAPDSVLYNRWREPDGKSRSRAWNNTLRVMRRLGLRKAWLGGCFLAVRGGQTVTDTYACLNHLGAELQVRGLFKWEFMGELIYSEEVPPPNFLSL
jgi:hypothetical protein